MPILSVVAHLLPPPPLLPCSGEGFGLGGSDGSVHRPLDPRVIMGDKNTATGLTQTPVGLFTTEMARTMKFQPAAAPDGTWRPG